MQIDVWYFQGSFLPLNGRTWHHYVCFHLFKESLCSMSDNLMTCVSLCGNENNRCRASLSLKSGAMKISVMQCKHCKSRLKDNLKILLLIIDTAPSMKTKVSNESV